MRANQATALNQVEDITDFKQIDYTVLKLIGDIDMGDIGLPNIQRSFVWRKVRVRDLFDSMYKGFPIGFILLWENNFTEEARTIGLKGKMHKAPRYLILDGQQRLTALYSVIKGQSVADKRFRAQKIRISFRPRDGHFEVANASTRRDPEYISDISVLWQLEMNLWEFTDRFIKKLKVNEKLTAEEDGKHIGDGIQRLWNLTSFPVVVLEVSAIVSEVDVANIFVRINNQGVTLTQGDFILTLLSVFAEDIRRDMEDFCHRAAEPPKREDADSPYNHFIEPLPDQLLRVSIALAFNRARMEATYQILRGKEAGKDALSPEKREEQFEVLRRSTKLVLDTSNWHRFLNAVLCAGFKSGKMVTSKLALLFSYAFYLIGKTRYAHKAHELDKMIGRWFFAANLTRRYTGSPETVMTEDLSAIRNLGSAEEFEAVISRIISTVLTDDYWNVTLPQELDTSASSGPYLNAYHAAQNLLGAPVLFSNKKISDLLDPTLKVKKQAVERHHLFPVEYLKRCGVSEQKQRNKIANLTYLEWPDNIDVSDKAPADYMPMMHDRLGQSAWQEMCRLHALPEGWEQMDYMQFLSERRVLMAQIIREGYETLL